MNDMKKRDHLECDKAVLLYTKRFELGKEDTVKRLQNQISEERKALLKMSRYRKHENVLTSPNKLTAKLDNKNDTLSDISIAERRDTLATEKNKPNEAAATTQNVEIDSSTGGYQGRNAVDDTDGAHKNIQQNLNEDMDEISGNSK
eukprot:13677507-Ditylum_brightwellii.AAC.1